MHILIAGFPDTTINYQNALHSLGATFDVSLFPKDISAYHGLLLPGGGDIHPSFFGEEITLSRSIDLSTDTAQFAVLDLFIKKQIPILGICKGMQLINIYFGGDIYQHLTDTASSHEYENADKTHQTYCISNTLLSSLYGTHFTTNSAHHQGVRRLGKNLIPLQYANDGVVEALSHKSLPIIGVQWHPERMCFAHARKDTVNGSLLLSYFLKLCC